ncbi:MAG: GNAT family N-acetyltransferase [Bacteroidia bacterium]|nr:GNAT family N-acetyltransferase [Bacteroidia bacterium]MCZ2247478.1 GNAT family N-acetyltransferase [Bacteroidia bacterium]
MKTNKIIIRKGKPADLPHALSLIKELAVYEKAPHEVSVGLEEMKELGFGRKKIFHFFVAEKNNKVIGLALYYFKYSTWKGRCLYLDDIIVTEKERGAGVGKLLFDKVAQIAKKENVRRMEWQVLNWNKPAINFYQKMPVILDDEWINCKLTDRELKKIF